MGGGHLIGGLGVRAGLGVRDVRSRGKEGEVQGKRNLEVSKVSGQRG